MSTTIFNTLAESSLTWECTSCGLPNINKSLFNSTLSDDQSVNSTASDNTKCPKKKAKNLRMFIINFQSLWGKKEELEMTLSNNDIDVVIGSESHLDSSIGDSEINPTILHLLPTGQYI